MRLTVLGGCGAWPEAGQACSGFLVEHDGFRLVVDLGYASQDAAASHYTGHVGVAASGLVLDLP